jgi:hypothetical protein
MKPVYNGRVVYVHNLSTFDAIYLLNILIHAVNFLLVASLLEI